MGDKTLEEARIKQLWDKFVTATGRSEEAVKELIEGDLNEEMRKQGFTGFDASDIRGYWKTHRGNGGGGSGGWLRDLVRECVEPNPGPSLSEVTTCFAKKAKLAADDARITILEKLITDLANTKYPEAEDAQKHFVPEMIDIVFEKDSEPDRKRLVKFMQEAIKEMSTNTGPASPDPAKSIPFSLKNATPNTKKTFKKLSKIADLDAYFDQRFGDLNDKIEGLESVVSKFTIHSSRGPTTFADWWTNNGPVSTNLDIPESNDDFFASSQFNCPVGSNETNIVLPMWENACTALADRKKNKPRYLPVCRTSKASIGHGKPDSPVYEAKMPSTEFYMALVGELKGDITTGHFANEHKGQVVSFLYALLDVTIRAFVYGFLCDGFIIQFFKLTPQADVCLLEQTPVYSLAKEGGRRLMWLLNATSQELGITLPAVMYKNNAVSIEKVLGHGRFSVVYSGALGGNKYVVKAYNEAAITRKVVQNEFAMLKAIQDLVPAVPEIVGLIEKKTVLLLKPVAHHFFDVGNYPDNDSVELRGQHIADLIAVLHKAHQRNIIHRDVKLANFFRNPADENKILLNDWSCACVNPTAAVPFVGTYLYAPDELLQGIVDHGENFRYIPTPKHDLESAVKCLYLSLHPFIVNNVNCNKPKHVMDMWEGRLSFGAWSALMAVANNCNYVKLQEYASWL